MLTIILVRGFLFTISGDYDDQAMNGLPETPSRGPMEDPQPGKKIEPRPSGEVDDMKTAGCLPGSL